MCARASIRLALGIVVYSCALRRSIIETCYSGWRYPSLSLLAICNARLFVVNSQQCNVCHAWNVCTGTPKYSLCMRAVAGPGKTACQHDLRPISMLTLTLWPAQAKPHCYHPCSPGKLSELYESLLTPTPRRKRYVFSEGSFLLCTHIEMPPFQCACLPWFAIRSVASNCGRNHAWLKHIKINKEKRILCALIVFMMQMDAEEQSAVIGWESSYFSTSRFYYAGNANLHRVS